MYKAYLDKICSIKNLSIENSFDIASSMLSNELSDNQIASLLTALKIKGETYEVITGFSKALKHHSIDLEPPSKKLIDVCGTGGDGSNTFNISTTVSFVLAAAGLTVAKHGNRSISSKSGSADLLNELGVKFKSDPAAFKNELEDTDFTFLFAPLVHPNMKYVMPVRTDLKVPTIFNIIGPLCNPYNLDYQVIGVYKPDLLLPMAKAVKALGVKRAAIIHGHNGMDELSVSGVNKVIYLINGRIIESTIDPNDFSISYSPIEKLKGGDSSENALITEEIFNGSSGPKLDVVALNAGLALYIGERTDSIDEGIRLAYRLIEDSSVKKFLKNRILMEV